MKRRLDKLIITIVSVENGAVPAGKKYQMLEVAYKDEAGKVAGKKILSFNYPLVFNTLKAASQGEKYEVTLKKEGEYWNWVEISKSGGGSAQAAQEATSKTKEFVQQAKNTYETPEERAMRREFEKEKQAYIIRQSSLSNAITTLSIGAKTAPTPENVIAVAKVYEAFVLDTGPFALANPVQELINMQDDLPD